MAEGSPQVYYTTCDNDFSAIVQLLHANKIRPISLYLNQGKLIISYIKSDCHYMFMKAHNYAYDQTMRLIDNKIYEIELDKLFYGTATWTGVGGPYGDIPEFKHYAYMLVERP